MKSLIYLDNSATTKPEPSVLSSYVQVTENYFANPSSIHQLGGKAENLLSTSRIQVANLLDVSKDEIIFTSGGTEGNNLAIKGIALEHQNRGKHIITTTIEHPSVYETCRKLEDLGFETTYLPVNLNGEISLEDLKSSIRDETILISIMHVNSEIGSIQPIDKIGEIIKAYPKIFFHVDNVQGFGKVPLNLPKSGIDLCTISGHKIHGLKGTGVLYVKKGTTLFSLFHGGTQENSFRSGTENLAGVVSLARAMRLIKEKERTKSDHLKHLQQYLRANIEDIEGVEINSPIYGAPHIFNISVPYLKSEVIIHTLSEDDIFISTKSACSSKLAGESRVLTACGYSRDRSMSALRISFSYENTIDDLSQFIKALKHVIKNSQHKWSR